MTTSVNKKTVGAIASAALLVSAGVTTVASVQSASAESVSQDAIESVSKDAAGSTLASVSSVQGSFAYDQNALTATSVVRDVFMKATQAMCSTAPFLADAMAGNIAVSVVNDGAGSYYLSVDDVAASDAATDQIVGCACSSNLAGGGAVANVEVRGIPISELFAATLL